MLMLQNISSMVMLICLSKFVSLAQSGHISRASNDSGVTIAGMLYKILIVLAVGGVASGFRSW